MDEKINEVEAAIESKFEKEESEEEAPKESTSVYNGLGYTVIKIKSEPLIERTPTPEKV
jgi:hypothetical protein